MKPFVYKDFVEILDGPHDSQGAKRVEIGVVIGVGRDHITVLTEDFENKNVEPRMLRHMNILEIMARMAGDAD